MTVRIALLALSFGVLGFAAVSRSQEPAPDFARDVLPVLSKAGCNMGACHGAAKGQNGFKLSLLGSDARWDYDAITREFGGRRVRLGAPSASLVLKKPSGAAAHGGGVRLPVDGAGYRTVLAWLEAGAPPGDLDGRVVRLEATPSETVLDGGSVQVRVTAVLDDGTREDRTALALYTPLDDSVATVTDGGLVNVKKRGICDVMVRYRGQVASVRVGSPLGTAEVSDGGLTRGGPIDAAVLDLLSRYRLQPSERCSDEEFARRASLVLTGRLPDVATVREFLSAPSSDAKRAALVDKLLASEAFNDMWAMRLADWMQVSTRRMGADDARKYHEWLRDQISSRRPMIDTARDLLVSQGPVSANPQANFYRMTQDPRDMAEFVGRTMLGKRVACARCHNHPYDKWTQQDYHRFAAVFAEVKFDQGRVVANPRGFVDDPKSGKPVTPALLGSSETIEGGARAALASALDANGDFSRALANLVWKNAMGRGVVEPVDDVRPTNPASNPALLEALAAALRESGYELSAFVRQIVLSDTFQLSSVPSGNNAEDEKFFSHAIVRPIEGAVLSDAIADVTGVMDVYPGFAPGTRAVQLPHPEVPSYTLDVLGRCTRETVGDAPSVSGGGLAAALHMINSPAIEAKVRAWARSYEGRTSEQIVEDAYLRALSRFPSAAEKAAFVRALGTGERRAAVEDFLWSVIHSKEFGAIR